MKFFLRLPLARFQNIGKALQGARESILEGDGGWRHVATLGMTARNGRVIEFTAGHPVA
jgi:hypothetical protein